MLVLSRGLRLGVELRLLRTSPVGQGNGDQRRLEGVAGEGPDADVPPLGTLTISNQEKNGKTSNTMPYCRGFFVSPGALNNTLLIH